MGERVPGMGSKQDHKSHIVSVRWFSFITIIAAMVVGMGNATAQREGGPITLSPCHIKGVEDLAQCGTLTVPENRAEPAGRLIDLNVVILPPSGGQPTKEPLYFLAGGPGQAATQGGELYDLVLRRARRGRDLVLVDQRGTGKSNPFVCEISDNPLAEGDEIARACLSPDSHDAAHYTSDAFIQDLEAVRAALGHEQISLMGISYGTRAALLYAKAYEGRVRAMVLDSVAPPHVPIFRDEAQFASDVLEKTLAACADDPDCRAAFPSLGADFAALLQSLDNAPVGITIPEADDLQLELTRELFLLGFRGSLYAPPSARLIPYIVAQASKGDFAPWMALADFGNRTLGEGISMGLLLSVQCAEEVPLLAGDNEPQSTSLFPNGYQAFWEQACAIWPRGAVPADFNAPVSVDTPTLLLSGGLDPITPPSMAQAAADHLSNAVSIVVPFAGHSVVAYGCANKVVANFLDDIDPDALDTECLNDVKAPAFLSGRFGPKP